jgi:P2-related tail formation protein
MASVRQVIEQLSQLDPDEQIVVEWWSKGFAENFALDTKLSDEQWNELVDQYEEGIGVGEEFAHTLQLIVTDELEWNLNGDEESEDE